MGRHQNTEGLAEALAKEDNAVVEGFARGMERAASRDILSNDRYGEAAEIGRNEVQGRQDRGEMRKR